VVVKASGEISTQGFGNTNADSAAPATIEPQQGWHAQRHVAMQRRAKERRRNKGTSPYKSFKRHAECRPCCH